MQYTTAPVGKNCWLSRSLAAPRVLMFPLLSPPLLFFLSSTCGASSSSSFFRCPFLDFFFLHLLYLIFIFCNLQIPLCFTPAACRFPSHSSCSLAHGELARSAHFPLWLSNTWNSCMWCRHTHTYAHSHTHKQFDGKVVMARKSDNEVIFLIWWNPRKWSSSEFLVKRLNSVDAVTQTQSDISAAAFKDLDLQWI